MKPFDFHTGLSERHRQIMDRFAGKEEYGTRRKVLERGLELLEAAEELDVKEVLKVYKTGRSLRELFNFVLVNRELIDGLARVALREVTMKTLLEKTRECTIAEFNIAKKVFPIATERVNSFSDMVESLSFYHKHLNIIGEVHVNEEKRQAFAKLNNFKPIPEIPLEILNTLLEESSYTFNLRLEEGMNDELFTITWVPPEGYAKVKKEREKYINSRRKALIDKIKS